MQEVYEDQGAIYSFVAQNPNIATLSFRPSQKWVEFYCRSEDQVKTLLANEWTVGSTRVNLTPAKKLVGSRIFLKMANVSPCHSEEAIRAATSDYLSTYRTVGSMDPHYIVDPTANFPNT